MSTVETTSPSLFPRWYLWTVLIVIAAVMGLSVLAYTNLRVDSAQDAEQNRLLGCFDTYALRSSVRSTELGKATQAVSEADQGVTAALDDFLTLAATQPAEDDPRTAELFRNLSSATTAKRLAQNELDAVRKRFPVPPAPSTFCASDDESR